MLFFCLLIVNQTTWTETTQSDFRDGQYESTIYSSRRGGGAIEFTNRWDLNNDGYLDIVIANEGANYSYVYWGSASGYSPSNRRLYPVGGAEGSEAGDLNLDGYSELIFTDPDGRVRVFRGTATGPDSNNYFDITIYNWNEACYLYDFNKDGWLDIAVSKYSGNNGAVIYGDSLGNYNLFNFFPSGDGVNNLEVADFNKDGWPDLVDPCGGFGYCYIYKGSAGGYTAGQRWELPLPGSMPIGSSVADLNHDGKLEVVLTIWMSGDDAYIYHYSDSTGNFVLWEWLSPGVCFGGSAIADLNSDSYLDILFVQGYNVVENPYIYWGSDTGYSDSNRTAIGLPVNGSAALIADFNRDQVLDVFVGNYNTNSNDYIFYGPNFNTATFLPNDRDKSSRFREPGDVYNRRYNDTYISSVFDAGAISDWGTVDWTDSVPTGTSVQVYLRSGGTAIPDSTWTPWALFNMGDTIPSSLNNRYLQYMAGMSYHDLTLFPVFYDISITYAVSGAHELPYSCMPVRGVRIFPNPARDRVSFLVSSQVFPASIAVYDIRGRKIGTAAPIPGNADGRRFYWDARDPSGRYYPTGVYFYRLENTTDVSGSFILLD